VDTNLYFGSRMIVSRGGIVVPNRLGSIGDYFPYGEEKQVTAQDRDKFATYYRDGNTGLDYAQNRYYANTLGRFTSPDAGTGSKPVDPGSWNKYVYTQGDPVNFNDPSGLARCMVLSTFTTNSNPDNGLNPVSTAEIECRSDGGTVIYRQEGVPFDGDYKQAVKDAEAGPGKLADQAEWSVTLATAESVRLRILNWQLSSDCESVLVQIKPDGAHPLGRTDVISAALRANFANGYTSDQTLRIGGQNYTASDAFKAGLIRGHSNYHTAEILLGSTSPADFMGIVLHEILHLVPGIHGLGVDDGNLKTGLGITTPGSSGVSKLLQDKCFR